jgi:hypothetical protein
MNAARYLWPVFLLRRDSAGSTRTRCADGRQRATVEEIKYVGDGDHRLPIRGGRCDEARRQPGGTAGQGQQRIRAVDGPSDRVRTKDGAGGDVQIGSDELMGEDQARITPSWRRSQDGKQLRLGVGLPPPR